MKRWLGLRAVPVLIIAAMIGLFGHVCALPHDHHHSAPAGSVPEYDVFCEAAIAEPVDTTMVSQHAETIAPTLEPLSPIRLVARVSPVLLLPIGRSKSPPLFLLHASFLI